MTMMRRVFDMTPRLPRMSTESDVAKRRILLVANEECLHGELCSAVHEHAGEEPAELFIIAPALNTRLAHWVSDVDRAETEAQRKLQSTVEMMREHGYQTRGAIGDPDPLQAIEDARLSHQFEPDEIIVSTHPHGRENWLEKRVAERARSRYAVPVTEVVVEAD